MKNTFDVFYTTRKTLINELEALDLNTLSVIPKGFNNHLLWQAGHCLVTLELLSYKLSGNNTVLSEDIIQKYRKGSTPEPQPTANDLKEIQENLMSSLEGVIKAYEDGMFQSYKPYMTSMNVELTSIEEALIYASVHEAMHIGTFTAMKKAMQAAV